MLRPGPRVFVPLLALAAAGCRDAALAPGRPAMLAVAPVLPAGASPQLFGIVLDGVRVVVVRPPRDTLADETASFHPDSSAVRLTIRLDLRAAVETLLVTVELSGAGVRLFSGTAPVEVIAGPPGATPVPQIPLAFVGPGGGITNVDVSPVDTFLTFGDSLRFRVAADSLGFPVTSFFVAWATDDPLVAVVNAAGLLRAPLVRSSALVTARTPSGVADATSVTFQPLASRLVSLVTGPLNGTLGTLLSTPLAVRVQGADGLGVGGVGVTFRVLTVGGLVTNPLVYTDAAGVASTTVTLGLLPGLQTFEASVPGLSGSPVTFDVNAVAAATRLAIVQQPPGSLFFDDPFTVQVAARDDLGNTVTSFAGDVTVSENPGSTNPGAVLRGTVTRPAVSGVATFGGLSVSGTDTTAIDATDPLGVLASATTVTFTVVNQLTLTQSDGIGAAPFFAGIDPVTDRVYVVNTGATNDVSVVDPGVNRVLLKIPLGSNPGWEAVNPKTRRVFVSDFQDSTLAAIDEATATVEATIPIGLFPSQAAVDTALNRIYVPALICVGPPLCVDVLLLVPIDGSTNQVVLLDTVQLGVAGDQAMGAVWDPVRRLVWVVVTDQLLLKAVDPVGRRVVDSVPTGDGPYGVALDAVRRRLFVTNDFDNSLSVFDVTAAPIEITRIPVGLVPQGVSVDPATGRVFVANYGESTISVIDGVDYFEIARIPLLGRGPGDAEFHSRNGLVYVPNGDDHTLSIVKPPRP